MEAKATGRYIRIAPRKVQTVINLIRGKHIDEALTILKYTPRAATVAVEKVVKSALANAENNYNMDRDSLYIAEIYANQGPTMRRFRPRAQGRATTIRKRTSHIGVVLKEK